PQLGMVFFEKVVKPMIGRGAPDAQRIDEALANFRRYGAVLNRRLDGSEYVVGHALTLADLTLASSMMYAQQTEVPLGDFPHVQAWFSHISALDAWKKSAP
ncbi:MAG: glutathione S-transferase family protein, partial [bacterium]